MWPKESHSYDVMNAAGNTSALTLVQLFYVSSSCCVGVAACAPSTLSALGLAVCSPLDNNVQVALTEVISSKRDNLGSPRRPAWQMAQGGGLGEKKVEEKTVKGKGGRRESTAIGHASVVWPLKRRYARLTESGWKQHVDRPLGGVVTISLRRKRQSGFGILLGREPQVHRDWLRPPKISWTASGLSSVSPGGSLLSLRECKLQCIQSAGSDMSPAVRRQYYLLVLWRNSEHSWIADTSRSLILRSLWENIWSRRNPSLSLMLTAKKCNIMKLVGKNN